jgi:hypothetical protein
MGSVARPRLGGGRPSRRRSPQSPALGRVSRRSVLCESPGHPPSRAVVCSSGPSMRPVTVGHNGPAWARGAGHLGPGARGRPPDGLALTHPGANLRGHQAHPRHPRFSPEPPAWQGLATRHPPRDFPPSRQPSCRRGRRSRGRAVQTAGAHYASTPMAGRHGKLASRDAPASSRAPRASSRRTTSPPHRSARFRVRSPGGGFLG